MKRFIAAILFLIYFGTTAGSALQLHYCDGGWMTELSMMEANRSPHCQSGCNHKDPMKDCCKHPKVKLKINPHQQIVGAFVLKIFPVAKSSAFHPSFHFHMGNGPSFAASPDHSPPRWPQKANSRQAFYGTFLI
jgi:hypothetical protein